MEKPKTSKSPTKDPTVTSQTGTGPKDLVAKITAAQEATFNKVQPEPEKETVTPPKEISFPNQNALPFCPFDFQKTMEPKKFLNDWKQHSIPNLENSRYLQPRHSSVLAYRQDLNKLLTYPSEIRRR